MHQSLHSAIRSEPSGQYSMLCYAVDVQTHEDTMVTKMSRHDREDFIFYNIYIYVIMVCHNIYMLSCYVTIYVIL